MSTQPTTASSIQEILDHCNKAHALAEKCYLAYPASSTSPDWLDKRKFLLTDLSLHMVHAALGKEEAHKELIRRYLYSLLTICKDFLPDADLQSAADKLIAEE